MTTWNCILPGGQEVRKDVKCIEYMRLHAKSLQLCLTLCYPRTAASQAPLLCPRDSPGKSTGVGCVPSSRGSSQPMEEPASLTSPTLAAFWVSKMVKN